VADALGIIVESLVANWMLFALIIVTVLAFVPWVALILLNVFNKNIWREIRATLDRRVVKIFRVLQNGQSEILYRVMSNDRRIIMSSNKKTGLDEFITPTTTPHPDAGSHKHVYVVVEGQEGTKNLLEDTEYDVNSPQKKMGFTMSFEAGREFERLFTMPQTDFDLKSVIIAAIPIILLIMVLIFMFSQNQTISLIAEAVGVVVD